MEEGGAWGLRIRRRFSLHITLIKIPYYFSFVSLCHEFVKLDFMTTVVSFFIWFKVRRANTGNHNDMESE